MTYATVKIVGDELRINNGGQIAVKSIANLAAATIGASAVCEKILGLTSPAPQD